MTRPPLFVCALWLAAATPAAALDLGQNQVLIDATLVSISKHEQMADAIDFFDPQLPIDVVTKFQVGTAAGIATSQTQSVITAIQGDAALAASPVGAAALGYLELARDEQLELAARLDTQDSPKAKDLLTPVLAGLSFQVAAVNALQGRPDRFAAGRRAAREASAFWSDYTIVRHWLAAHGLPTNANTLFEPFPGGKGKTSLDRIGLFPQPDVRAGIRDGQLELAALSKLPVTSGLDFAPRLTENFTILMTIRLPEQRGDRPREELNGFSAGIKVSTDPSNNPAETVFIEHQTSPDGWVQSLTGTQSGVFQTFPHASASPTREITSFIIKSGGSVVVGSLLKDGQSERLIQSAVSVLGELPALGLYFRNGTTKTTLDADNLLIFLTPQAILPH
jgi:hypothetical protein